MRIGGEAPGRRAPFSPSASMPCQAAGSRHLGSSIDSPHWTPARVPN